MCSSDLKALLVIKAQLNSPEPRVKLDAVYSLGLLRNEQALPWLAPLVNDTDETIAFFAKEAIERIKTGW